MANLMHLADLLFNRPLLVTPEKARILYSVLAKHNNTQLNQLDGEPIKRDLTGRVVGKPYQIIQSKIAVISVVGTLVNRGSWVGAECGIVSYEGLEKQLKTAVADNQIEAIVFDFDSPGGDTSGCFELAEQIRNLSQRKKIVSFVNGMACSAAYALASATSEIVATQSSSLGSIGVFCMHWDFSKQLDMEGVTPTYIYAGAHKIDGNSSEPLSESVKNDLQAKVDYCYESFLATVAKGRGKRLPVAAARKTEARCYISQEAVQRGLADRIDTFDNLVASLIRAPRRSIPNSKKGVYAMDTDDTAAAQAVEGVPTIDNAKALAEARKEGESEGAKAAYERMSVIASAEAIAKDATRMKAAFDLAIRAQTMPADDVIAFVANNVAETKASSQASLASRLAPVQGDPLLTAVDSSLEKVGPLTASARERAAVNKNQNFGGKHD